MISKRSNDLRYFIRSIAFKHLSILVPAPFWHLTQFFCRGAKFALNFELF